MKITPDVIRDLMPLVKDGVASDDSAALVYAYLEQDTALKEEFEQYDEYSFEKKELFLPPARDVRIIAAMKRSLVLTQIMLLIMGTAVGVALTDSFEMMYNLLIMPFVGALSLFTFRSKWKLAVPVVILAFAFAAQFLGKWIDGEGWRSAFADAVFFSVIYAMLVSVGMIIGALLKYAFGKGSDKHEQIV